MEIRHSLREQTRRPWGARPEARFALWRAAAISGVELQTGLQIEEFALPVHFHDSYQFDVMLEGGRSFDLPYGRRAVAPGCLTVVHPGEAHAVRVVGRASSFRTMHVDTARIVDASRKLRGWPQPPAFPFAIDDGLTVSQFLTAHRMIEGGDRLTSESALAAFLDRLITHHTASACRHSNKVVRSGLHRARDFVETNLTECVPLDTLAVAAGISKFYLVRQFTLAFGLPPHAYQVRVRIARARELLAAGAVVKQVSAELGFADQSHFGRHFRKATGLTPAEYQRRVTGRTRAEIPLHRR